MNQTECGFFAVNGKHCVIGDHCVVCQKPNMPKLQKGEEIVLQNFGEADGTYKIINIYDNKLKLEFLR